jgi:hypothetical protein
MNSTDRFSSAIPDSREERFARPRSECRRLFHRKGFCCGLASTPGLSPARCASSLNCEFWLPSGNSHPARLPSGSLDGWVRPLCVCFAVARQGKLRPVGCKIGSRQTSARVAPRVGHGVPLDWPARTRIGPVARFRTFVGLLGAGPPIVRMVTRTTARTGAMKSPPRGPHGFIGER